MKFHLENAKEHGVTQKEIAAIITHAAFYAGWPKGWAVFHLAKEVWDVNEDDFPYEDEGIEGTCQRNDISDRGTKRWICTVFFGKELSCSCFCFSGRCI